MTVATAQAAIRAQGLTKLYGTGEAQVRALDDASFEITPGEFVVLLGPSGSGKTTLLNQVGALEEPTSGSLEVAGRQLSELDDAGRTAYRRDTIGFVFQFYNLVPTLTALENVALMAEITGADPEARAAAVLERVGLGNRLDHFPSQLSGGEQQRISIARALVKDPPLLLCDEPTGALDVDTGKHVLALLHEITHGDERTVVLVTHNSTIARMADRVLRLRDGAIISDEHNPEPADPEQLEW